MTAPPGQQRAAKDSLLQVLQPPERQLCADWAQLSTGACCAKLAESLTATQRSHAAADCAAVAASLFRRLAVARQQAVRRADGEWESAVEHVMPRIVRDILRSVCAVLGENEADSISQAGKSGHTAAKPALRRVVPLAPPFHPAR